MSDSSGLGTRIRNGVLVVAALVVTAGAGLFVLPSVQERLGIAPTANRVSESRAENREAEGSHSGHDHSGEDHSGEDHSGEDHSGEDHSGHDHSGDSHADEQSITISPQARGNLGLRTQVASTSTYTEYASMPATIVDWPGRTHVSLTAPLTGVVNAIFVSQGELVRSGQPMFTLRLTHQDLVKTQSEFLAALGRLDVEEREIKRLTEITASGAVAGKTLIQRQYEHDRLRAELRAERQAMLLHGLTEQQIVGIENRRELVRMVTVHAPSIHEDHSLHHDSESWPSSLVPSLPPEVVPPVIELLDASVSVASDPAPGDHVHLDREFLVTRLTVNRGESVEAGQTLGRLSDYSNVLVEGHAFQKDGTTLRTAAKFRFPIQALIDSTAGRSDVVDGLRITYIGNEIGVDSRSLPFFVSLKNSIERSELRGQQRYVSWRFKPGQRLQLRVPLQGFDDTIVVPVDAVAKEGDKRYVFVDHGDHFERRSVRVLARDAVSVAIENDGSIRTGQTIAASAAHQLQMAMKGKSSGPIDPHAGHNH